MKFRKDNSFVGVDRVAYFFPFANSFGKEQGWTESGKVTV